MTLSYNLFTDATPEEAGAVLESLRYWLECSTDETKVYKKGVFSLNLLKPSEFDTALYDDIFRHHPSYIQCKNSLIEGNPELASIGERQISSDTSNQRIVRALEVSMGIVRNKLRERNFGSHLYRLENIIKSRRATPITKTIN